MPQQLTSKHLLSQKHWVFDMDGTLTIAQHDFDAIRDDLGLPDNLPILESLDAMPAAESAPIHQRLNEIELEIAAQADKYYVLTTQHEPGPAYETVTSITMGIWMYCQQAIAF